MVRTSQVSDDGRAQTTLVNANGPFVSFGRQACSSHRQDCYLDLLLVRHAQQKYQQKSTLQFVIVVIISIVIVLYKRQAKWIWGDSTTARECKLSLCPFSSHSQYSALHTA